MASAVSYMALSQNDIEGEEKVREDGYLAFDLEDIRLYLNGADVED